MISQFLVVDFIVLANIKREKSIKGKEIEQHLIHLLGEICSLSVDRYMIVLKISPSS